jgi:phosphate starvation-inducible membrane PsiE
MLNFNFLIFIFIGFAALLFAGCDRSDSHSHISIVISLGITRAIVRTAIQNDVSIYLEIDPCGNFVL